MGTLFNLLKRSASQALRLVPGTTALRWKRDLRDDAWLAEADAVVVSYPKSGRTFVRSMVSRLYQRRFGIDERQLLEFPLLRKAAPGVPRLLFTHAGDAMRTPGEIRLDPRAYEHAKVVLIARHPGDVAVSRFHHLKHRSRDRARKRLAEQPLQDFVWDKKGGIPSIVRYLNLFADLKRSHPSVTIIRYEDFLDDPQQALGNLAEAIGLGVTADDVADAAAFGEIGNLKAREREGYFTSKRLRRASKADERSAKVRKGGSGGYRANLPTADVERIDAYVASNLDPIFGYSKPGRGTKASASKRAASAAPRARPKSRTSRKAPGS